MFCKWTLQALILLTFSSQENSVFWGPAWITQNMDCLKIVITLSIQSPEIETSTEVLLKSLLRKHVDVTSNKILWFFAKLYFSIWPKHRCTEWGELAMGHKLVIVKLMRQINKTSVLFVFCNKDTLINWTCWFSLQMY